MRWKIKEYVDSRLKHGTLYALKLKQHKGRNWLHVYMMTSDHPQSNWAGPTTLHSVRKFFSFLLCQTGPNCLYYTFKSNITFPSVCTESRVMIASKINKRISILFLSSLGIQSKKNLYWYSKIKFLESVCRRDECKVFCTVKAIHHSLRRKSSEEV